MSMIPARWRVLTAGLAAAVGLGGAAQAQTLAPQEAPAALVAYAELATQAVSSWLSEDSEPAGRLRRRLLGSDGAAVRTVALKVWIDADGSVSKVEAPDLADPDAGADLAAVVVERRLQPPPPRMLQPLRLAIDLEPPPEGSARRSEVVTRRSSPGDATDR